MSKTRNIEIIFTKEYFEQYMGHPIDDEVWHHMATQIPWLYPEDIEEGYWNAIDELKEGGE